MPYLNTECFSQFFQPDIFFALIKLADINSDMFKGGGLFQGGKKSLLSLDEHLGNQNEKCQIPTNHHIYAASDIEENFLQTMNNLGMIDHSEIIYEEKTVQSPPQNMGQELLNQIHENSDKKQQFPQQLLENNITFQNVKIKQEKRMSLQLRKKLVQIKKVLEAIKEEKQNFSHLLSVQLSSFKKRMIEWRQAIIYYFSKFPSEKISEQNIIISKLQGAYHSSVLENALLKKDLQKVKKYLSNQKTEILNLQKINQSLKQQFGTEKQNTKQVRQDLMFEVKCLKEKLEVRDKNNQQLRKELTLRSQICNRKEKELQSRENVLNMKKDHLQSQRKSLYKLSDQLMRHIEKKKKKESLLSEFQNDQDSFVNLLSHNNSTQRQSFQQVFLPKYSYLPDKQWSPQLKLLSNPFHREARNFRLHQMKKKLIFLQHQMRNEIKKFR